MIRRTIRLLWRGAVIGFLTYALFFARLGDRTPFQHLVRVISTDEAQELGHEVGVATKKLSKHIGEQVYDVTQPPEVDAGASRVPEKVADQLQGVTGHAYRREHRIEAARDEESR
ncbi:MAG: hypothetical protein OES69_18555 [Myxococcales bacterium]|jgi:hypothetical protein|nr:hypothetical protein [Myxococcales bacterium]MDH3845948.1 hypothetical protein [Myxococcales bacterium]